MVQDPYTSLNPAMTVGDILSEPLGVQGISGADARSRVAGLLDRVHLPSGAYHRLPREFSGGQRPRVAIARAIVGPRRLILADEPTGALDSVTGEEVMRVLRERIDAGAAGLLVTHDARFAAWADRTIFLRDGQYVDGTRSENPGQLLVGTE